MNPRAGTSRPATMKLVADANVLFSSLIRDGTTRRLWTHPGLILFAPSFIVEEFIKYENELLRKSGTKPDEFKRLLSDVLSILAIVPDAHLDPFMPAAATLSTDKKDWPYLALALKENAAIWSNDAEFKRQNRVKTFTTAELIGEVGKL